MQVWLATMCEAKAAADRFRPLLEIRSRYVAQFRANPKGERPTKKWPGYWGLGLVSRAYPSCLSLSGITERLRVRWRQGDFGNNTTK